MAIGNLNIAGGGLEAYPIGSIYMSFNSTEPSILFGGTQERIKDRFILAAGDSYTAGATGGETTHEHNLSNNGYASIGNFNNTTVFRSGSKYAKDDAVSAYIWTHNGDSSFTSSSTNYDNIQYVGLRGKTDSASSMPPYLVAYMWYRTA